MLNLLEAIKKVIERYVVGKTPILESINVGETAIKVASVRRFNLGDTIAIYNKPSTSDASIADIRTIVDKPDCFTLIVDSPLTQDYPESTSGIEKCHYGTFLNGIYVGNPNTLPGYPAIAIEADYKENSGLTLESTSEESTIFIWVFADATDYESQYKLMLHYAQQIETALWRTLYPLAEPYFSSALRYDASEGDLTISLTEPIGMANVFLEGIDHRGYYRINRDMGGDVYELTTPIRSPYCAGDAVISPRRHFYETKPESIDYGTINSESGPLKAALLTYVVKEEKRRYGGYSDPLTF